MKKILSLLSVITISASIPTMVVACSSKESKEELPKTIIFGDEKEGMEIIYNPSDLTNMTDPIITRYEFQEADSSTLDIYLEGKYTFNIKNEEFEVNFKIISAIKERNNWSNDKESHWLNDDNFKTNIKNNFKDQMKKNSAVFRTKISSVYHAPRMFEVNNLIPKFYDDEYMKWIDFQTDSNSAHGSNEVSYTVINKTLEIEYR